MTKIRFKSEEPTERICKDGFFKSYLQYTDIYEGHEEFHLWIAISLIACALGRKCYFFKGDFNFYANLYIILVGESASGKSSALGRGTKLLKDVLGSGFSMHSRATPAKLIHDASEIYEKRKVTEIIMVSSELANFLGPLKQSDELLKLLTDWYDCDDHWESGTMMRGTEECHMLYPNLIAASTPTWFQNSIPEASLEGGFWSRLIPVFREPDLERRRASPEDLYTQEIQDIKAALTNDLKIISRISGRFMWTNRAKEIYEEWYYDPTHSYPQNVPSFMKGYYGRKGTTLTKLSMIMSASKRNSRIIEEEDFMSALALLNRNEDHIRGLIEELSMSEAGRKRKFVIDIIKIAGGQISHAQLIAKSGFKYDAWHVKNIINSLLEEHTIIEMTKPKPGYKLRNWKGAEE